MPDSAGWRASKRSVEVLGRGMAYVERGEGRPIVLLHGNPTSSFLWREVLPSIEHLGRCIVPDLIGMGDSDPLEASGPGAYRFVDHRAHLDAFLSALGVEDDVVLLVHDWGSALGFDWANRHRASVRAIAYMEAIVRPLTWSEFPDAAAEVFRAMRSPAGEEMVFERNVFIERILPGSILRELAPDEMAEYRRPFAEPGERRRPMLTWPRQIPLDGEPEEVCEIVRAYADWLRACEVPKLFVNATPGAILTGAQREFCRTWPNQTEVTVPGSHFIQEDSGAAIGEAVAGWLENV